ncbi:uncharacterized protein UTRI_04538 [Ustilago trichophora]|uniref:Uncharacterized protein n=1 Tax=Ustilago trichophora TaxID=86804 RepID=A0A5C3EEL9_9BASI|nr:uncharacterized protein UTRI_04538 [Ustilago trichophora]
MPGRAFYLIFTTCLVLSFSIPSKGYGELSTSPQQSTFLRVRPFDTTSVSFDDIMSGRFQPTGIGSVHIPQLIEGEEYPHTLLFADPPKPAWAPIVDVTEPISFRALNALVHRYRHLHVYRSNTHEGFDSYIVIVRKPPIQGVAIIRGSRIHGLNQRIQEIEYIRQRYGSEVVWSRFHRLFTPFDELLASEPGKATPTWADIVASDFVPSLGENPVAIREHLNRHRLGKFKSLDGKHWLGIRVKPMGIADHYESMIHEARI